MPDETEDLINKLFLEHYGLDDSMEIMRIVYNKAFDSKTINYKNAKEELTRKKIFSIYVSANKTYEVHYRLHSEKAIDALSVLSSSKEKAGYLENKIVNFFNSSEWETWAWKYVESCSEPLPYKAQKKHISVTKE